MADMKNPPVPKSARSNDAVPSTVDHYGKGAFTEWHNTGRIAAIERDPANAIGECMPVLLKVISHATVWGLGGVRVLQA